MQTQQSTAKKKGIIFGIPVSENIIRRDFAHYCVASTPLYEFRRRSAMARRHQDFVDLRGAMIQPNVKAIDTDGKYIAEGNGYNVMSCRWAFDNRATEMRWRPNMFVWIGAGVSLDEARRLLHQHNKSCIQLKNSSFNLKNDMELVDVVQPVHDYRYLVDPLTNLYQPKRPPLFKHDLKAIMNPEPGE